MSEQVISELENAAAIIMAPPNIVSNEQRHSAESFFLDFRKSKSPYAICRAILEKSQNQYVLFEAAEVMKAAVIREWSFLPNSDKVSLQQYLFQYVTNKELPPFVRDRILQIIAIMVKMTSIEDNGRDRANILQEVENLIVNAEPSKKILGCNIIYNLLYEYATKEKSTDLGLPLEIHFKAKEQFEATDLKRIFQFCVNLLSEVDKTDSPFSSSMIQLIAQILKITETIFTWCNVSDTLAERFIGYVHEADGSPALELSEAFSDIILSPEFLPLMFQIYWKVRDVDQLAHHSLNCLVQLASLNGRIMSSNEVRMKYLQDYMMSFFKLLPNLSVRNKESLGLSNIVKELINNLFFHDIPKLPKNVWDTLLDEITRLTCHLCDGAALEEFQMDDQRYFSDAFDNVLGAWKYIIVGFIHDNYQASLRELEGCSKRIFSKYLQCHLAPPDGCRRNSNGELEEIEDHEHNDRIRFRDQLQAVGVFGRIVPDHALPVLFKLLEERINKLVTHIQMMQGRAMDMSEGAALDDFFKDIHWIILIAGHVLCVDYGEGGTPAIPLKIVQYSITQVNRLESSLDATLKAIHAIKDNIGVPENFDLCDHVIRILFSVFELCFAKDYATSVNLSPFMSPEVESTLMWFLNRWCLSYFSVENYYHQEMSPTIRGALGEDTDGAKLIIKYVLSKIRSNLTYFKSKPIILRDTMELFCEIVCVKQKSLHIAKTENMKNLIRMYEQLEPGTLPPNILRLLTKGFVLAGAALQIPHDSNSFGTMKCYFETILIPLQMRFRNLLEHENFARVAHEEKIQKIMIDLLESFIGIAKGTLEGTSALLFNFLAPILGELPVFMAIYKDYQVIVQLILELFGQSAKYILYYLSPLDSKRYYEASLATVQAYARCNKGRLASELFAEENGLQDLMLLLDLFTFILFKLSRLNQKEKRVIASDVSLFGLNFIMPLITIDLLKHPNLCSQYYELIVLIKDFYPEKICNLPFDLLQMLLQSIKLGLTNFDSDMAPACLKFLRGMARYIFGNNLLNTPISEELKPYLKLLIDLTISKQINSVRIEYVSSCIYSLICCYQEEYRLLIQSLVQMQSDPLIAERLAAAFNQLILNVPFTCEHSASEVKFMRNFKKFVDNVLGFLLVK